MDWIEALHDEAPDLSGEIKVLDHRAVFNGTYSCVYKGKLRPTDELVAIKVLNAIRGTGLSTMRRKINRERKTWSCMRHPNILPLYGFAEDDNLFKPFGAFISPWRRRGDLGEFLAENGETTPLDVRLRLWKDVVAGVLYLHSYQPVLIHGDLKPGNILIDDSGNAQICDFGLVRVYLEEGHTGMTTASPHSGTARYLAWELVMPDGDAIPTTASDIYATGCIGLEVIFLQKPYQCNGRNLLWQIMEDMRAGKPPAARPSDQLEPPLDFLWLIISWCWEKSPFVRPQAYELSESLVGMAGHHSNPPTSPSALQNSPLHDQYTSQAANPSPRSATWISFSQQFLWPHNSHLPVQPPAMDATTSTELAPEVIFDSTSMMTSDILPVAMDWVPSAPPLPPLFDEPWPDYSSPSFLGSINQQPVSEVGTRSSSYIGMRPNLWTNYQTTGQLHDHDMSGNPWNSYGNVYHPTLPRQADAAPTGHFLDSRTVATASTPLSSPSASASTTNTNYITFRRNVTPDASMEFHDSNRLSGSRQYPSIFPPIDHQDQHYCVDSHWPSYEVTPAGPPLQFSSERQFSEQCNAPNREQRSYSRPPQSQPMPASTGEDNRSRIAKRRPPNHTADLAKSCWWSPRAYPMPQPPTVLEPTRRPSHLQQQQAPYAVYGSRAHHYRLLPSPASPMMPIRSSPQQALYHLYTPASNLTVTPFSAPGNDIVKLHHSPPQSHLQSPLPAMSPPSEPLRRPPTLQSHSRVPGQRVDVDTKMLETSFRGTDEQSQLRRRVLDDIQQQPWFHYNHDEPKMDIHAHRNILRHGLGIVGRSIYTVFLVEDKESNQWKCFFGSENQSCKKSTKRFERVERAIEHVRSHLGHRPFACDGSCHKSKSTGATCGKRFFAVKHLEDHKNRPQKRANDFEGLAHVQLPQLMEIRDQLLGPAPTAPSSVDSEIKPAAGREIPLLSHFDAASKGDLIKAHLSDPNREMSRKATHVETLQTSFTDGSYRADPALRSLLISVLSSPFYKQDVPEPTLDCPQAELVLLRVRRRHPLDPRFASGSDDEVESVEGEENEAAVAASIFTLFIENNQCLICGAQNTTADDAVVHVRSDIGHRPYRCNGSKCLHSPRPRRFFSQNLLDRHTKEQDIKHQCRLCLGWFRRGGMRRHMTSKHLDRIQQSQEAQNSDEEDDFILLTKPQLATTPVT